MAKPLIQVALDSLDYEQTLALARQAAPYVDIIEIGTPCLKVNGLALVKAIKAAHPDKLLFVDLKTMDAGYYEAEPFFKAGADITTVLGTADLGTIKGVVDVANAYGKQAQVDLINVEDKATRATEAAKLGAHIIGIHTGIDQQLAGQTPFADLAALVALGLNVKVSVAGGIKQATVQQVVKAGPDIVVIGGAITGSPAAELASREIRELVDAAA
ncbi:MAG: 3-hexulose-6-phosphate synthase [Methylophilaceae bacterium]|jgi:3-hexulose-6-phosphate synthase|uniref:3-hexulose-6-phosphate synthase n=1 Tax=Methylobacillus sp. MM3 TaxID=1848039 RepID=UPI0007E20EFC|nr:3-hexulose-6-phosphate synthase [Methylobacillus sp. MM3]OAJ71696.1 3-hexulose-6-phosphate synthase [Methylobacillus sp. MM3]